MGDVGQTVQSDLDEIRIVVDHERAAGERGRADAADQHQVREYFAQAGQVGDAIHDQVLGDLAQLRVTVEVLRLGSVQQYDAHVAVYHGAVLQLGQAVAIVLHVQAVAHLFFVGHGRRAQRPQPDEHGQAVNVHEQGRR